MNISDEAIEAAAKWLHDHDCRSALHSGFPADIECHDWIEEAKELLEASAPHAAAAIMKELRLSGWHEAADIVGQLAATP